MPPGIEGLDIYIGAAITVFIFERAAYVFKSRNGNGLKATVTRLAKSVEKLEVLVGRLNDRVVENSVKIEFLIREGKAS